MKKIIHKHHILPKHMGGTDDEMNLEFVTIEEHAQRHKELFQKYGKYEDKAAWYMLSGRTTIGESLIRYLANVGFRKFLNDPIKKKIWQNKISNSLFGKKQSDETKLKRSISFKELYSSGKLKSSFNYLPKSFFQENYKKNKYKMEQSRKSSEVWKKSVSSIESKQKRIINSPKSKKIKINNITYNSIREASRLTNYSYFQLRKILNSGGNDKISFI